MGNGSKTELTLDPAEWSTEQALGDAVASAAGVVVAALTTGESDRSRSEWVALAGACQSLVNTVTAAQDLAVAEAARREGTWCEDGTLGEQVHGPGAVTLDAADVVAPALGLSHSQAQRRVEQAVQLALGRAPAEADRGEAATENGLGGLHAAMAGGDLDGYRAGIVAFELEEAPAEVADAVVAALAEHLAEDAPTMRRRVRRLLARISPDLLRQRAERARASTGLRRWVAEPGVDAWFGTFPSEEAATAWAAVDRLAHRYVADRVCSSVEQARGRALTDLVTGNATVDVQVVLTVPAEACPGDAASASSPASRPVRGSGGRTARSVGGHSLVDGTRRATGADHSRSPDPRDASATAFPQGDSRPDRNEDLIEVQGARPSEPMFVRRAWLVGHLWDAGADVHRNRRRPQTGSRPAPCDPHSGARLDVEDALATTAYRPSAELVALVRARDGRCRFPGCAVAARFCDLDHVRPWPTGATAATNLLCLCRRHHRIKQSPGWLLRLGPDGTATWSDPLGAVRTSAPLNALDATVLRHEPTAEMASGGAPDRPVEVLAPWSALETRLELHFEHTPRHRRCTSSAALRAATHRPRGRAPVDDLPPF